MLLSLVPLIERSMSLQLVFLIKVFWNIGRWANEVLLALVSLNALLRYLDLGLDETISTVIDLDIGYITMVDDAILLVWGVLLFIFRSSWVSIHWPLFPMLGRLISGRCLSEIIKHALLLLVLSTPQLSYLRTSVEYKHCLLAPDHLLLNLLSCSFGVKLMLHFHYLCFVNGFLPFILLAWFLIDIKITYDFFLKLSKLRRLGINRSLRRRIRLRLAALWQPWVPRVILRSPIPLALKMLLLDETVLCYG